MKLNRFSAFHKNSLFFITCFLTGIFPYQSKAQENSEKGDWVAKKTFEQKVFIENKGQLNGDEELKDVLEGRSVLFTAVNNGTNILFTNTGLLYHYKKPVKQDERENKEERQLNSKGENEERGKSISYFLQMEWQGANQNTQIVPEERVNNYYTYAENNGKTIKASAFQKITYKNIYSFIDIEYIFPADKGGIKYNIILHSGANPGAIKMVYENANSININEHGDILISSEFGDFTDHAPKCFYQDGEIIASAFELQKNTVSFQLNKQGLLNTAGNIKDGRKVIIDPWTITPNLPDNNKAFEIGKDSLNNVYIYGGVTSASLQKYDPNGTLLWTFNAGWSGFGNFGDMAVSPGGIAYLTWYGEIKKINAAGAQIWNDITSSPITMGENWRCAYNCDYSKLVVALCSGTSDIYTIDAINNIVSPSTVTFATNGEIRALAKGFNGNFYGLTINGFDPQQIALSSTFTPIYSVASGQNFSYAGFQYNAWGGQNAIAANNDFIFSTDGNKLFKRNIVTGLVTDSTLIPGGVAEQNSGIDLDDCGNIYCGSQSYVYKFNSSLAIIDSVATPSAVYDLTLGINGGVYACGNGFLASLNITTCPVVSCVCILPHTTNADCTGGNNGTATITPTGTGPFTYLWSNGQTTATATGLSVGTYTVSITSGTGCVSTGEVIISPMSAEITAFTNCTLDPNTCTALENGTAVVTPTPGSSPYTYSWNTNPVQTNDTATGLAAGVYSVIVTDTYGCMDTVDVAISSIGAPEVLEFVDTFFCQPSIFLLVTNGFPPYSYSWSTGDTIDYIYLTAPGTYTYTVTATDSSGCVLSTTGSVVISNVGSNLSWNVGSIITSAACNGNDGSALVHVLGTPSSSLYFSWYDINGNPIGNISDTAQYNLAPGTYYCEVFDQMFCKDTVITLIIAPSMDVNTSAQQSICPGGTVTLTATGALSYSWTPPAGLSSTTGPTVTASPSGTTTYTVTGTSGNCSQTDSSVVVVYSTASVNAGADVTIASGETASLAASGAGTYIWSTGATTSSISVSPTATTLYYVSHTDGNGCISSDSVNVIVECQALIFPNVYTPNEDGQNDVLLNSSDCPISGYKISVYNRWGDIMFESDDASKRWDGKHKGKKCSEGVYYYIIDYQLSGSSTTKTGFVTLLR